MENYSITGSGNLQRCVYCKAWSMKVWMIESFIPNFVDHRVSDCMRCDLFSFYRKTKLTPDSHACFECFFKEMIEDLLELAIHYILVHNLDGLCWSCSDVFIKAPSPLLIQSVYAFRPNKTIINLAVNIKINNDGYFLQAKYEE